MSVQERATVVDGARVVDDEALLAYHALVEVLGSHDLATRLIHDMGGRRIPTARQVRVARKRRAFVAGQLDLFPPGARSGREAARALGLAESTLRRWRKPLAQAMEGKQDVKEPAPATRKWKVCRACGLRKPPARFYVDRRSTDGRTSRCKACVYMPRQRKNPYPKNRPLSTGATEKLSLFA